MKAVLNKSNFVLKVLSGLHVGAEIVLEEGKYIIGASSRADIILQDKGLKNRHARLVVKEKTVFIEALEGTVSVDKKKITKKKDYPVDLFQEIFLNTTVLILGRQGVEWPEISPLSFSVNKNSLSREEQNKASLTGYFARFKDFFISNRKQKMIILGFFIFFSFIVTVLFIDLHEKKKEMENTNFSKIVLFKKNLETLKEMCLEMELCKNIEIFFLNRQKVVKILGYFNFLDDRKIFIKTLEEKIPYNIKIMDNSFVIEEIEKIFKKVINKESKTAIRIDYLGNGNFSISGILETKNDIKKLEEILFNISPGVKNIAINILPLDTINFTLVAVSLGKEPYVVLENGKVFRAGNFVSKDLFLMEIKETGLVFKRHGLIYFYKIGG